MQAGGVIILLRQDVAGDLGLVAHDGVPDGQHAGGQHVIGFLTGEHIHPGRGAQPVKLTPIADIGTQRQALGLRPIDVEGNANRIEAEAGGFVIRRRQRFIRSQGDPVGGQLRVAKTHLRQQLQAVGG